MLKGKILKYRLITKRCIDFFSCSFYFFHIQREQKIIYGCAVRSFSRRFIRTIRLSCPIIVRCMVSDTFCSKVIKVNDGSTHGYLINCFEEIENFL